ncbi:hypothetical protein ABZY81_43890, partial [Streptomyces sp. NPDC006514]
MLRNRYRSPSASGPKQQAVARWGRRNGYDFGHDEFRLHDLRDRLAGADWTDDEFAASGLDEDETAELRAWSQRWALTRPCLQRVLMGDHVGMVRRHELSDVEWEALSG